MRKGLKSREVNGNQPLLASLAYHLVFADVEVRIVAKGC